MTTENATTALTLAGDYDLDPAHSRIGFSARHAMVTKVRGSFGEFSGSAHVADDPAASHSEVTIRAASLTTGQDDRDGHLRSGDFLDVETHPELTFRSTGVVRDGDIYRISGELTVRDVTRPVTVDFEFTGLAQDPFGNVRAGFEGRTSINRKDFGLTWNS